MTFFRDAIASISNSPEDVLSARCVIALQGFLYGYERVDLGVGPCVRSAALRFDDTSDLDLCSKALLSSPNTAIALNRALEALLSELDASPPTVTRDPGLEGTFVDAVRLAIAQGRPGMSLGEPTCTWLADYATGHIAGKLALDPAAGKRERDQLNAFEAWLRIHYGAESAQQSTPWHSLIRVYEGLTGSLPKFLVYWDQFERAATESGA